MPTSTAAVTNYSHSDDTDPPFVIALLRTWNIYQRFQKSPSRALNEPPPCLAKP